MENITDRELFDKIYQKLSEIEHITLLSAKTILTVKEVAILTGLSVKTIYQLVYRKELPYYKPNIKNLFFDKKDVEEWMKKKRYSSKEEIESEVMDYIVSNRS